MSRAILVKCGGFSTQLAIVIGEQIDGDPLWGSRFDAINPTAVVQTHLEFLQNGAQIILSNTYQSSIEGFMKHLNLTKEESIQLMRKSVQLAKEAKQKYIQQLATTGCHIESGLPLIMASIGPYGAHLHDGSEYSGSYEDRLSTQQLKDWHRTRIDACLAEGVDGLAVETIPCQLEATAVLDMILEDYAGVKFWISLQCKDEKTTAHGEIFADVVHALWRRVKQANAVDRLFAIGVNCTNPKFVTPLLESVHQKNETEAAQIPFIVYSNRGETYDAETAAWTGQEKCVPLETYVPQWVQLGAKIIGGCCRVYPADILNIRKCIDNIGNNN